jgi:hypothetical protein
VGLTLSEEPSNNDLSLVDARKYLSHVAKPAIIAGSAETSVN